jgi:signal transduction histidine kinase
VQLPVVKKKIEACGQDLAAGNGRLVQWLRIPGYRYAIMYVLLSLLLAGTATGQEAALYTSVYNYIPDNVEDTLTIATHIRQGETLIRTTPDSAIIMLGKALKQSEQAVYVAGMRKSLQLVLPLLSDKEKEAVLQRLTYVCTQSPALEPVLAVVYNAMAKVSQLQEQYEQAGNYYIKAIGIAGKYQPEYLATVYNNYGSLLSSLPDSAANYQRSIYYLDKAEQIARQFNDLKIITCVLCNKAKLYRSQKRYGESMDLSLRGLELARQHHFTQWELVLLNNIGDLYFSMGKPREAISFLEQSLKVEGAGIDPYYRNMAIFTLGEVYYALDDKAKAEYYFTVSLKAAEEFGIVRDLIEANRKLALIYAARGDYARAFKHQLAYSHINDSIRNKVVMNNVQQLEVKYRTSEKDRELLKNKLYMEHQEQSLHRKNTIITLSVVLVMLLVLTVLFIYTRFRQKQKLLLRDEQIREMRALIQGEEQERIRLAQELHDGIGGMLAAVNMNMQVARKDGFTQKQELLGIMQMIEDTTDEVRKTSHNLMPSALLRENLKEALQHYCDNVSGNGTLCVELNTYGNLEQMHATYIIMIFRIVQELVQNVIRHAGASHVIVSLERMENQISLLVEDNGKGFDVQQKAYGFGLENLSFRVKTLGGALDIRSMPGAGTSVTVSFEWKDAAA